MFRVLLEGKCGKSKSIKIWVPAIFAIPEISSRYKHKKGL